MTATLYFNGPILTMDADNSSPEAVLTEGEMIRIVGDEADLRATMPDGTHEVDLDGQTMIPAFIDPHGHFPDSGFNHLYKVDLSSPPLGDCYDIEIALMRLREKAAQTPAGEWVLGSMYDHSQVKQKRLPTRDELDKVSMEHPIWVVHMTGHNGSANSLGLERRGISDKSLDPANGRFGRNPKTNRLNGVLEGIAGMGELGTTSFENTPERFRKAIEAARDEYLAQGVTFAQNAWCDRSQLENFATFSAQEDPGIDIVVLPVGELEPALSNGEAGLRWPGNQHITLGPRKMITDGSIQLQTAMMTAPYNQPVNSETPNGILYMEEGHIHQEVLRLHNLGYQIHCHCNGDASADMFLDAVDAAMVAAPREDHRHTIIHGQTLRDDQLQRMADLGVTVSFFSAHVYFWGDVHFETHLGAERAQNISPARSAEKFGVRYTIHNDAPVTPTRPLHLMDCAVNRKTAGGRVLGADQKISVLSALRAQTIDAAWQVFKEKERGSIEPGKFADFAILSENPLTCDVEKIGKINVLRTVRRGKRVFDVR